MNNEGDNRNGVVKRKIKNGDRLFFSELIERYQYQVYQICFYMIGNREEAVDVAQSAFIKLYINMGSNGFDKISSRLFRITVDLVFVRLQDKQTNFQLETEIIEPSTPNREILQLTPDNRLAIVLKHILGMSIQDISEIMQISVSSTREKVYKAREELRNEWKE